MSYIYDDTRIEFEYETATDCWTGHRGDRSWDERIDGHDYERIARETTANGYNVATVAIYIDGALVLEYSDNR